MQHDDSDANELLMKLQRMVVEALALADALELDLVALRLEQAHTLLITVES